MEIAQVQPHEAMSKPTMGVIDRVKKWAHDHLTVSGREEQVYLNQYQAVLNERSKTMSQDEFNALDVQMRQKAHSAAVGSMVVDGLIAGGTLVTGGVLMAKERKTKFIKKFIQNKKLRSGDFKGLTFRQAQFDKAIKAPIDFVLYKVLRRKP